MLRIKRGKLTQIIDHFPSDMQRGTVLRSAMHRPMTHRGQWNMSKSLLDAIHQRSSRLGDPIQSLTVKNYLRDSGF
jgi:hypothetical protein